MQAPTSVFPWTAGLLVRDSLWQREWLSLDKETKTPARHGVGEGDQTAHAMNGPTGPKIKTECVASNWGEHPIASDDYCARCVEAIKAAEYRIHASPDRGVGGEDQRLKGKEAR